MLGQTWYIVGGGNNSSGCADLVALDVSPLTSVPAADASGEQGAEPAELPTLTWSHVVTSSDSRVHLAVLSRRLRGAPRDTHIS